MADSILTDLIAMLHSARIANRNPDGLTWIMSHDLAKYILNNLAKMYTFSVTEGKKFLDIPMETINKEGFFVSLTYLKPIGKGNQIKQAFYEYALKKNDVDNALDDVIEMLNDGDLIEINRENAIYRGTLREYIMADIDGKRGYFGRDELTGVFSPELESSD